MTHVVTTMQWTHEWRWCTKTNLSEATVIATIAKKNVERLKKRRRVIRSCWVRLWICDHPRFGGRDVRSSSEGDQSDWFQSLPQLLSYESYWTSRQPYTTTRGSEGQFQLTNKRSTSATFDKAVAPLFRRSNFVRHCCWKLNMFDVIIIIIIHEFHEDTSLETKLQGAQPWFVRLCRKEAKFVRHCCRKRKPKQHSTL